MRVYATVWRLGLQDAIQYRIEGFIWFLFDVLPPLMMLAFWSAAYEGSQQVAGYALPGMLAYTIGVMVLRNLITSHIEWEIDYAVRQGTLSNFLVRPLNVWAYWFMNDSAWRAWRMVMLSPIVIVAIATLLPSLEPPSLSIHRGVALVLALVLGYLVCFLLKLSVGFTSFWLTDVNGVSNLFEIVVYLLGGVLIPIELLPEVLVGAARQLPFQYIYAFPLSVMLDRVPDDALFGALMAQLTWVVVLSGLAYVLWRAGLRRYEAVGG